MEDNVLQLPSALDRLARKLGDLLGKDAANRQEWIAIQEDICLTLAEARNQFSADIAFGEWCESNGFDAETHQTRAAAIAMGNEPEALRKCLEATERQSLEKIYRFEFDRFTHVRKPDRAKKRAAPKRDAVREEVRSLIENDRAVHRAQISEKYGVGESTIQRTVYEEKAKIEALAEASALAVQLPPAEMLPTMRQRYEATVKATTKRLREEITAEVTAEIHKQYDAALTHLRARVAQADAIIESHRGLMTKAEFRKIKACLHPDHNSFAFAAEALQIFSSLEDRLVKPEQPKANDLPATLAELLARRKAR